LKPNVAGKVGAWPETSLGKRGGAFWWGGESVLRLSVPKAKGPKGKDIGLRPMTD